MTFGGAANPSQWSDISEITTDLLNNLVRDPAWDPDLFQSPHQHLLKDSIVYEDDLVPLAQALELAVELPADDNPKADCYINDIFNAFLETDVERGSRIIPFILHLFGRPLQEDESLQCDDILSIKKLLAEATPAERQTILGWIIDTRRLLIQLPENKFLAWTHAIDEILAKKGVKHSDIERLIGRLNHAGFIIPMSRHFLGRLQRALYAAVHRPVTLKPDQCADLLLWKGFLLKAHSGISLNLLTYRLPTHIGRSDECSERLQTLSNSARRRLENYDLASQLAALDHAVTDGTTSKQARYWQYWNNYLKSIELDDDPFLSAFSRSEKHRLIAGFGAAVRANDVQDKPSSKGTPPVSSTIRTTFDAVAQAYRANDIPSPIHDADGKLAFILQRVVKGYANTDPSEKQQKAITSRVVRLVTRLRNADNDSDDEDTACGQLCGGAWFFAMRS